MYFCETCGLPLPQKPIRPIRNYHGGGFWESGVSIACPYCQSPHIRRRFPGPEEEFL